MKQHLGFAKYLILLVLIYLFFIVLKPFLPSIFLALAFSIVFYPLYKKLLKTFRKRKNLASFLTVTLTFIVIILPLISLLALLAKEAVNFSQNFDFSEIQELISNQQSINVFNLNIDLADLQEKAISSMQAFALSASSIALDIFSVILNSLFLFFVFLLLYFYFLRDGEVLISEIKKILPFETKQNNILLKEFHGISKTVFLGITLSALISGMLATIGFAIFGSGQALIWGLLVGILSLIPTVGSFFVYLLGMLVTLALGGWISALALAVYYVIVDLILHENFIKPKLLDDRFSLHPILIFLAIVGGVNAFGSMGVLYGPMIIIFLISTYSFIAQTD